MNSSIEHSAQCLLWNFIVVSFRPDCLLENKVYYYYYIFSLFKLNCAETIYLQYIFSKDINSSSMGYLTKAK